MLNDRQFGILIAYVIPGFIVVHGLSHRLPDFANWLGPGQQPTVGGFLYVTLASVACGLVVSTARWLVVDTLLHCTGIEKARWSLAALREQLAAFEMFVLYTYRYYQFHANCFVAIPVWFALRSLSEQTIRVDWLAVLIVIETILLAGARDTLSKYHARTNEILNDELRTSMIVIP